MIVNGGEDAKFYRAVRLDSLADVNKGDLTFADDQTGEVRWMDGTATPKSVTLGPHAIRIVRAGR